MKLDNFLCFAVYSASHAFNRVYKELLKESGLTYPQYLVMVVLWEGGTQTVGGIGERLQLDSNTLTPLLKRLEAMGLVTRQRMDHDERQVSVGLTGGGRALRNKLCNVPDCLTSASGMTAQDLSKLQRDMTKLRKSLGEYSSRAGSRKKPKPA